MRFDPTEDQRLSFIQGLEDIFKTLRERSKKARKEQLEKLYKEFKKAQTTEELNQIRQKLIREFRDLAPGRRFFGQPLRGPEARSGIYKLRLVVGDTVCEGLLTIRDDPLFNKKS